MNRSPSRAPHVSFPNLYSPPLFSNVRNDLSGAITGTLASLPQTIAYGVLAASALGPQWIGSGVMAALYGAIILGVAATILGTSPLTVAGPRATTALVFSLLTKQLLTVPQVAATDNPALVALALAFLGGAMAGMVQVCFARLKLGRLVNYIPDPVIAGFLNGSALLIILDQIPVLLSLPSGQHLSWQIGVTDWSGGSLALGLGTTAVVLLAPRLTRALPALLIGLAVGMALYQAANAMGWAAEFGPTLPDMHDGAHVALADLWRSLRTINPLDGRLAMVMAPSVLSMAVLASLDTLLAVRSLDALSPRRANGNRDLNAQGIGNILAGLAGCLPGSGGMGRATAMIRGGGRTALSPLLIAAFTMIATAALMPTIRFLPQTVMAGALVVVAMQIFDPWTVTMIRRFGLDGLRRQPLSDLISVMAVMAATLLVNLVVAVGVGVLISLAVFVVRMSRSPVRRSYPADLLTVRLHGDIERVRFLEQHGAKIAVIEVEGALFFGSAAALETYVETLVQKGVAFIVLDLKRIKDVDTTGARALERMNLFLVRHSGALAIAHVERERRNIRPKPMPEASSLEERRAADLRERFIWRKLEQVGTIEALGEDAFHPDVEQASENLEAKIRRNLATHGQIQQPLATPLILQNFTQSAILSLRRFMLRTPLQPGQFVFRQGDPPDRIYYLASGRVEVTVDLPGTDRKLKIQTMTKGAIFGEMAVLDSKPRSANVIAVEPAICYSLTAAQFNALKIDRPEIAFTLLENVALIFSERLRASGALMADLDA